MRKPKTQRFNVWAKVWIETRLVVEAPSFEEALAQVKTFKLDQVALVKGELTDNGPIVVREIGLLED